MVGTEASCLRRCGPVWLGALLGMCWIVSGAWGGEAVAVAEGEALLRVARAAVEGKAYAEAAPRGIGAICVPIKPPTVI